MVLETQLFCLESKLHNCTTPTHRVSPMCIGAAVVEGKRREQKLFLQAVQSLSTGSWTSDFWFSRGDFLQHSPVLARLESSNRFTETIELPSQGNIVYASECRYALG